MTRSAMKDTSAAFSSSFHKRRSGFIKLGFMGPAGSGRLAFDKAVFTWYNSRSACCGVGGCAYALVPGFVVDWQARINSDGLAVSQVEPVSSQVLQREIRRLIERQEPVHQVVFL